MSSIPRRSAQCWVIKIGSSLLTAHGRGLDLHALRGWVAQMQTLRQKGLRILLVSSGAIAEGKMGIAMMGDIFEVKSYKII